jgi:hypothetical protein
MTFPFTMHVQKGLDMKRESSWARAGVQLVFWNWTLEK